MVLTLSKLEIQREKAFTTISCRLSGEVVLQVAIYASPKVLGALRPEAAAFLYLAYLVALQRQVPLVVTCDVGGFQWMNLIHNFAPLVSAFYSLPQIPVSREPAPAAVLARQEGAGASGLMFSGGVDSFYSLLELRREKQTPDYLISVNAGSYPRNSVWHAAFENLGTVGRHFGRPLIMIDTNFHHVLRQSHLSSHTVRNITAAMLLRPAVSTVIYSSSTTLTDVIFSRAKEIQDMSSIEALVLYTMQQRDFGALIYGLNVERIDKTKAIQHDPMVQNYLNVCTNWQYQLSEEKAAVNCGQCGKCIRTQLTLEALGSLDSFSRCFDLAQFRRNREALFAKLKQSHYRIDHAVVELLDGTPNPHD